MKVISFLLFITSATLYSQDSTNINIKPLPTTYEMNQQQHNNKTATPKTGKGQSSENLKFDSTDVNSCVRNMNVKYGMHPDRMAYLYGDVYSDFERDKVILNADSIEDVYVKKIYYKYEISDDGTISYHYKRYITCLVNCNDILGYMYLPEKWFEKYLEPFIQQTLLEITSKFIEKYGKKYGTAVANKEIQIGMTKEMVEDSWGKPKDINRTVGSWGVHEQWVYSNHYLYFENGKLTSWQD